MTDLQERKGPRRHRVLIYLFAAAFTVLLYWLLGFIVNDIGNLPGPSYAELEESRLDSRLTDQVEQLQAEIEEVQRDIAARENRQARLRDSTDNSRQTMDQLLEIQRQQLEDEVALAPEERQAMAEAKQSFLANQQRYQELNAELADREEQLRELEDQTRGATDLVDRAREPIRAEYETLLERHNLKVGALKLSLLVPLLLLSGLLLLKARRSNYVTLVYALGIAVALKVTAVMHEHFPTRYFKYILILAMIAVVLKILHYLLKMVAHPRTDWLLKQYREAYESFLCPVCGYPIRRGPLKYLAWSPRSIRKLAAVPGSAGEEEGPYTCPACTTPLYEKCDSCGAVRPSLLPACDKCGAVKPLAGEHGPAAAKAS